MNAWELLSLIETGETSEVQFKEKLPHLDNIAKEMVAMSNSLGGVVLIGVKDKTGDITGLNSSQIEEYDRKVSEVADNLEPPVYITTDVVKIEQEGSPQNVLILHIQEGTSKPYKTKKGEIYVKQASNKRLVTENAEIKRLFQQGGDLCADEMEVHRTSVRDLDGKKFSDYFTKEFQTSYQDKGLTFEQALEIKKVLYNNKLTLAGLLFFGKDPQAFKPAFTIKAVSYFGNKLEGNKYRSKPKDLTGTIPELFEKGMDFLKSNLDSIQSGESFNAPGKLEISSIALEELLQNALVHRDYFKNSPIILRIFDNRIEIVSPGKLPNNLTVENIQFGNSVIRNNQLASFSRHTLPYSGLGTGVKRSLAEQPNIKLINDIAGEQFTVIIPRPKIGEILSNSNRIEDILVNPQLFLDFATQAIKRTLYDLMIDGIKYQKIGDSEYEMALFEAQELEVYLNDFSFKVSDPLKTIYEELVPLDSGVESQFAKDCETSDQIKFYFKLPNWFKIPTPIGHYNPDWAIVFEDDKKIYFVAETKDTGTPQVDSSKLSGSEQLKIKCGKAHFNEFDKVEYRVVSEVRQLIG